MSESTHEASSDKDTPIAPKGQGPIADIEALAAKMSAARAAVGQAIYGQELVVEESMITPAGGWPHFADWRPRIGQNAIG